MQAISSVKRESLTMAQQEAIKSVINSDPDEEDPWGPDEDDDECSGMFTQLKQSARSACKLHEKRESHESTRSKRNGSHAKAYSERKQKHESRRWGNNTRLKT